MKFHASPSEAGLASSIFIVEMLVSRICAGRYIYYFLHGRKAMYESEASESIAG
jgi:hypothetical protein